MSNESETITDDEKEVAKIFNIIISSTFLIVSAIVLLAVGISFYSMGKYQTLAMWFMIFGGVILGLAILFFISRAFYIKFIKNSNAYQNDLEKFKNLDLSSPFDLMKFGNLFKRLTNSMPNVLALYMTENLDMYRNCGYISSNVLNQMLSDLANELNYDDMNDMFDDLENRTPGNTLATEIVENERVDDVEENNIEEIMVNLTGILRDTSKDRIEVKSKEPIQEDVDLSIPISKVYFIDEYPVDKFCMITGLPIDIKNNLIVACPHCGNMAGRDVLMKWIFLEKICPVCKKSLKEEDIPMVILKP